MAREMPELELLLEKAAAEILYERIEHFQKSSESFLDESQNYINPDSDLPKQFVFLRQSKDILVYDFEHLVEAAYYQDKKDIIPVIQHLEEKDRIDQLNNLVGKELFTENSLVNKLNEDDQDELDASDSVIKKFSIDLDRQVNVFISHANFLREQEKRTGYTRKNLDKVAKAVGRIAVNLFPAVRFTYHSTRDNS